MLTLPGNEQQAAWTSIISATVLDKVGRAIQRVPHGAGRTRAPRRRPMTFNDKAEVTA